MSTKLARLSVYVAWEYEGGQHIELDLAGKSGLPEDVVVEFKSKDDLLQQADRYWEKVKEWYPTRKLGMTCRVRSGTRQPNGWNSTRWGTMQFHAPAEGSK